MARKSSGDMSGWTGWVGFAAIMMLLIGFFHIIAGFAALFTDTVYLVGEENIWALDYTTWGWIHILGGLLVIWAASSLMQGNAFGRTVAVILTLVSAVVNMLFVPIYPFWSLLIITIDILVLWAVIVHGGELKE